MNTFRFIILIALLGNTALALFVLISNPKRTLNKAFAILASLIVLWLGTMAVGSLHLGQSAMLFITRQTSALGGILPLAFYLLFDTVSHPEQRIRQTLFRLRWLLLLIVFIFTLCHSPFFIRSVEYSHPLNVAIAEYGFGFVIFMIYFITFIGVLTAGFVRMYRSSSGVQREELLFLQLGACTSLAFGITLLGAGVAFDYQEIARFLPLAVLVLDGFVAYGIATRRILSASVVIQRGIAYALMILYLSLLYLGIYWMAGWLFILLLDDTTFLSHLLAALVLAFSVVPAHGWMQAFAHHLVPAKSPINSDAVLKQARNIFQEIATEDRLTASFAQLVMDTFGTSRVMVVRPGPDGAFIQQYPECPAGQSPMRIEGTAPLITLLYRETEPVTLDMLARMRASTLTLQVRRTLEAHAAPAVAGCFIRHEMKAALLLSTRQSGRIYDLHDQRTLQILCDQFAVALENANLYTAVQNAKIYNDILLDALTSGIVAVDADRTITVLNQRAQQITGIAEADATGRPMDILPDALMESLYTVLESQTGFRDRDMTIRTANREIPLRVSGTIFYSHTGSLLGAMLIVADMTELKTMEDQIRRSDRLSSIGTLSAGMAHEIKNPLVTIKTFTQLLPEQHNDPEFRRTFFELVDQEVKRIDTIVTRLLHFARPAKVALQPVSLHTIADGALKLVEQQLIRHGIRLERDLAADRHCINADPDQLNQAFINLLLNAVDAMKEGGTLTVRTRLHDQPAEDAPSVNGYPSGPAIELVFEDTGCGMTDADRDRIFDPFFTTKEHGIGLGLSVSHGIIQEHHGRIHVQSRENAGTVFHIQFPLIDDED